VSQCPDFPNVFAKLHHSFNQQHFTQRRRPYRLWKRPVWSECGVRFPVVSPSPALQFITQPDWTRIEVWGLFLIQNRFFWKRHLPAWILLKGQYYQALNFVFETDFNFHFFFISLKGSPNLNSNQCTRTSLRSLPVCEPQCIIRFQHGMTSPRRADFYSTRNL
jgi:hypothetical protein